MNFRLTPRASRDYLVLLPLVQAIADKQLDFLVRNLRHPSLRAKKYDAARDIWQGRVTRDYRFYFTIDGEAVTILSIVKHPK